MPKGKLPKSKGKWKQATVIGAVALAASGIMWLFGSGGNRFPVPAYRAMRVIDGDTFETNERQLIRLTGIQAPEIENCGGKEAKRALEKLIMGKNLYIKVIYRDGSHRLISHVYNERGFVSAQMVRLGMAYNLNSGAIDPELDNSSTLARKEKIGIFSSKCVQSENLLNPKCVIKANNPDFGGKEKVYHFPGCGQYNHTLLELYKGDRWFCTEAEAKTAGFVKGADCFGKSWE